MIDRALFGELGGMSEEYVIGDFEDSDLCLRGAGTGLEHLLYAGDGTLSSRAPVDAIDRRRRGRVATEPDPVQHVEAQPALGIADPGHPRPPQGVIAAKTPTNVGWVDVGESQG